jgi:hypothetical protein
VNSKEVAGSIRTLLDPDAVLATRLLAARRLASTQDQVGLGALLGIALDESTPETLGRTARAAIAEMLAMWNVPGAAGGWRSTVAERVFSDRRAPVLDRVEASRYLARLDDAAALSVLLKAACDESEEPIVACAAGASIAEMLLRQGRLDQIPFERLTSASDIGYDAFVARHMRLRL